MTRSKSVVLSILIAALLPMSSALAEDKPEFSGFLGNYSDFRESKRVEGAWVYSRPDFTVDDLKHYDKLIIDPVQMMVHKKAETKTISQETRERVAGYFREAIRKAMEPDYKVVDAPGKDVIRVRAAITNLVPKDVDHAAYEYLPVMLVFRAGKKAARTATDKQEITVEATLEMEFDDSVTGERLMAIVDGHRGARVTVKEGEPDIDWQHVTAALDYWAKT
ncbi:MAG: DUF3313 domain-containing protein, partial [Gammaproteobacteria bacterium]|nr:DUF3313 domain-containing protein [Gammaproteobacteria bacterium]